MDESDVRAAVDLGALKLRERAKTAEEMLEQAYDEHARSLFRYALAILGSADDVEDAVQEVWVRLARAHSRLMKTANLKAYLFAAARNAAFSILRSRLRRNEAVGASPADAVGSRDEADRSVQSVVLRDCLMSLSVEQREVVLLKVYDSMTFDEIARTVGISANTAASRYRYGVEKLKRALEDSDG